MKRFCLLLSITGMACTLLGQSLGANFTGLTVTAQGGDIYRVSGTYSDPIGVTTGTDLLVGDYLWTPALNPGETCRAMPITSIVSAFAGFVEIDVEATGQGAPSTQNAKLIRHTPNKGFAYVPAGGSEALRECISQSFANIIDSSNDSLWNYTATNQINLDTFWLSPDGTTRGFQQPSNGGYIYEALVNATYRERTTLSDTYLRNGIVDDSFLGTEVAFFKDGADPRIDLLFNSSVNWRIFKDHIGVIPPTSDPVDVTFGDSYFYLWPMRSGAAGTGVLQYKDGTNGIVKTLATTDQLGATACVDSTFVSSDTLFIRNTDCSVDTIVFSIPVPPDTAYVSGGQLVIAWNGNIVDSDTISLGSGLPVITSTPSTVDTATVSYLDGNINELNATNVNKHILFSSITDGGEYILRLSNVTDSLSLDDRLFWIDETGAACNVQVKTNNASLSFYSNGSTAWVTSSTPSLSCYTPIASTGTEYGAIIAHAQTNGHSIPTLPVQIAGDSLISELKTLGVWDSLDQMLVLATDGDAGFSLINWVNPGTNNADTIGSPTFTTLAGWSTDATPADNDEAINLLYNPTDDGVNWKQDYATFIYDYTGTQEQSGFHFGSNANPKSRSEIDTKAFLNGTTEFVHATHGGTGLVQYSRTGNTLQVFKNGSSHASTTSAATGLGSSDFYLMALELSGAPFGESGGLTYRLYMSGGDLSSFAAGIDTAWDNYLSQLGL